jgi:hypothetical protein
MRLHKALVPLTLTLSLLSLEAQAISRYNSQSMSCARVQAVLRAEGAAILSWRSKSNAPLYNRFVTHGGFCENTEITRLTSVPTSDSASCKVLRCIPKGHNR